MAEAMEVRAVEQRTRVVYCDRCGKEIPTERNGGGGLDRLEGANISARGKEWVPLIPVERASTLSHSQEFHAANVDLCGACVAGLQEWFLSGERDA
jgi:hypothetical protein